MASVLISRSDRPPRPHRSGIQALADPICRCSGIEPARRPPLTVRKRVDRFEGPAAMRGVGPFQVALALRISADLTREGGDPRPS